MISDNERREVARRLRETGEKLGRSTLLWYHIAKSLGVRTATDGKTACGMLADLIEPPLQCPYYRSDRHYCSIHDVPAIDRDALIEMAEGLECKADDIIRAAKHAQFSGFGPSMGEAEHDAYEWRCIAHRIREALGVES